jgi:hemerythrin
VEKLKVSNGIFWVEVPEADLRILCGCPANSIKLLMKRGLIVPRQKGGVSYETGPNAILLCDTPIQKGSFTNLSEFPVLQMLYRQGMLVPGHPNNTGRKPMLIGLAEQVRSQSSYIFAGNYGLASEKELMASGLPSETAHQMMRMKRWFAFGRIRDTEELLTMKVVENDPVEIAPGVSVRRTGMNRWEFLSGGQSLEVDLTLGEGEEYETPFDLGSGSIRREYFSVIHIGEGDGWDPSKPCMGSIVCFQGRLYLIDAGPNIMESLTALGISVNEIEGIFQSHCHDDHFAGLTSLVRSDRRLRYFAVPAVRATVEKKLGALMGIDSLRFARLFDVQDLVANEWNPVDGLDVRPLFSYHPVETTVLFFRAHGEEGTKTYAHLADLPSSAVLDEMVTNDPTKDGISAEARDKFLLEVRAPMDVKKVDAGRGPIHGVPEDFASDTSKKIILSHIAYTLTDAQKEIGSNAAFGQTDVLIPVRQQAYVLRSASHYLGAYFPDVPPAELGMLLNCRIVSFNAGSIFIRKGAKNPDIFLILSGTAEVIDPAAGFHDRLAAGALAGELSVFFNERSLRTFRAESAIDALQIPGEAYRLFIARNGLAESMKTIRENRQILSDSRLFGDMASFTAHREVAQLMERRKIGRGRYVPDDGAPSIFLLAEGEVSIRSDGVPLEIVLPGGFWGEASVVDDPTAVCVAQALRDSVCFSIPAAALREYPSVYLKLLEAFDRRMRVARTRFRFEWHEFYEVGIPDIDNQHRKLFSMINNFSEHSNGTSRSKVFEDFSSSIVDFVRSNFKKEEEVLEKAGDPRAKEQGAAHRRLLEELEELVQTAGTVARAGNPFSALFRGWFVSHTLIAGRVSKDFAAVS